MAFDARLLDPLSADDLTDLALEHRVGIPAEAGWSTLAAQGLAPPVPTVLRQAAESERFKAMSAAAWLYRLGDALTTAGIAWIALKGPALSQQLYDHPAGRSARDLDILVEPSQLDQAVAVANALGWNPHADWQIITALTGKYDLELTPGRHGQPLLEIHRAIAADHAALRFGRLDAMGVAPVTIAGRAIPALAGADALIYIASHGAKHLWMRLNWLLDLAAMMTREPLDGKQLIDRAQEIGAETAVRAGLQLAASAFDIPAPALPAAAPRVRRASERLQRWTIERWHLGPSPSAIGGRPWSYRWHLREARTTDHRWSPALRLRSLLEPIGDDVRRLGPHRSPLLHMAARPYFVAERMLADLMTSRTGGG